MKNSWIIWVLIVAVVVGVLIAFNYQNSQNTVPLSDIFPEDESTNESVQYEFVDNNAQVTVEQPNADMKSLSKTTVKQAVVKQSPAKVSTQPIVTQVTTTSSNAAVDLTSATYAVQVLSVKDKVKATKIVDSLKQKGLEAFLQEKNLGEKGSVFRVYAGKFNKKSQAEDVLNKIKGEYKDAFILVPKK